MEKTVQGKNFQDTFLFIIRLINYFSMHHNRHDDMKIKYLNPMLQIFMCHINYQLV